MGKSRKSGPPPEKVELYQKVVATIPDVELKKFLAKYKTTLFAAYGIVQKEYATVPDALLAKTTELGRYFKTSFEYAKTLKPKATKRKS